MTEVVIQGTVKPDGTLELSHPVNLPPGEVRVIVQAVTAPSGSGDNVLAVLERIWAERRAKGMQGRSGEQIDADIQCMRDEWEDHQRELERLQARTVKE
jgi:hypothetical protein